MTSVECTCRERIKWIIQSEEDKTFTPGSGGWYVQITTFLNHSNDVYQITVIFVLVIHKQMVYLLLKMYVSMLFKS